MLDDKFEQGDRFFDTLTNEEVKVYYHHYNVKGKIVELEDHSRFSLEKFNQRFKFLYGHRDVSLVTYLIDSLSNVPNRHKELLGIIKNGKQHTSEYALKAYNCLGEAFDNLWNPKEKSESWSAICNWVSTSSEHNNLIKYAAECLNHRKDQQKLK
ncbi:MAG: hypothetical protein KKA62_05775 [Nanoarchaeota archaeon]|nr:hypothetical protein [Nanoarchaeota archaeon]